ncbi:hypothetical protein TRAPUB_3898 [Trametes pubescens]|uniref:Uncharacterized protein n=1 Tax=Trametes pubescens TaxID=154538 RepID=A0A1M2W7P7_TRAPU|nr:hypothetical protein TRAPUB_3898 [Trametes pubescens]
MRARTVSAKSQVDGKGKGRRTYEACMPNIWAQANGSRESVWLPECAPGKATAGTYKVHGAFDPAFRVVLPNSDRRGT